MYKREIGHWGRSTAASKQLNYFKQLNALVDIEAVFYNYVFCSFHHILAIMRLLAYLSYLTIIVSVTPFPKVLLTCLISTCVFIIKSLNCLK